MSYYFVVALFPFFIFLAALVGFLPFTDLWSNVVSWIAHYLPREARHFVLSTVLGLTQGRIRFLSVGVVGTAWTASTGIMSLMESLNAAYEVQETRSYWKRRGLAILILIILSLLTLAAFGLLSTGHWLGVWVSARGKPAFSFIPLWHLGRWLLSVGLIGAAAAIADYALPNLERAWRWVTPGRIFVMLAGVFASLGFDAYVQYIASYNKTYGALGALIILMAWIYIVSLIVLIGAEVNCELERIRPSTSTPLSGAASRSDSHLS